MNRNTLKFFCVVITNLCGFYITDWHIYTSTAKHIQTNGNLTLTIRQSRVRQQGRVKGPFMTRTFSPRASGVSVHTDCFFGIIEHETETSHLLVRNNGRTALTAHHHITADSGKAQDFHTFFWIDMYKNHHWKQDGYQPSYDGRSIDGFLAEREQNSQFPS